MTTIPTIGGVATRGEVYRKLLDQLGEAQDCAALMAHLHPEANAADRVHRQGWLAIEQLIGRMRTQITKLATRGLN